MMFCADSTGMRKTVVLTSRENFAWLSMQEIVPVLEEAWVKTAIPGQHEIKLLNVDKRNLKESLSVLMDADQVVVLCFTVTICKILSLLRNDFGLKIRLLFYLHGQVSVACWPFRAWGLEKFYDDDVFMVSCSADTNVLGLTFDSYRTEVFPYFIPETSPQTKRPPFKEGKAKLFYVGRVSPQKNIHTLLCALRILKSRGCDFELDIYGADDNRGSPNMGLQSSNYENYLKNLVKDFGLIADVNFKGHQPREKIESERASQRGIFISPSLHADENFGMACLRALKQGHSAVLSDWGGHRDFKKHWDGQVKVVSVYESSQGPWISASELADSILDAVKGLPAQPQDFCLPEFYREENIISRLGELAMENFSRKKELHYSSLANTLLAERTLNLEKNPLDQQKIFHSYADERAHLFFRLYGMSKKAKESGRYELLPWVKMRGQRVEVEDPHRGHFQVEWDGSSGQLYQLGLVVPSET